jgi:signal peptidase II
MSPARRNDALMVATGVLLIVLDQLTKYWIRAYFTTGAPKAPIPIVGNVLELDYVQNTGVAFSLLEGQTVLFVFIAVALCVIGWLYWRTRATGSWALKLTFGLILGGAAGNLIDRIQHDYVVDFIHFQIPGIFNFAVFNVADSGITIGVLMLAYLLWRGDIQGRSGATSAGTLETEPASAPASPPTPHVRRRAVGGR